MENNQKTNPAVGRVYCRRLKEVRAVQVRRNNEAELRQFVGGGQLVIPRSINGIAVFTYGRDACVKEGDYIVMGNDGLFYSVRKNDFECEFEPKDAIQPNIGDGTAAPGAKCCGNCVQMDYEDASGNGVCLREGKMTNCGDSACNDWIEK